MTTLLRTDSAHPDFKTLVAKLDAYLAFIDGEDHAFYAQYNKVDLIKHVVVVYEDDIPVACGAIKAYDLNTMEVKRMYTNPESRGKGLASKVIQELEAWAAALGYTKCVLETGIRQPEAISLYQKLGYHSIENYGQYAGVETSVCFEKELLT